MQNCLYQLMVGKISKLKNGIIDVKLDKKLNLKRNRIAISTVLLHYFK